MASAARTPRSAARYRRITLWSTVAILVGALVLPLTGYVWVGIRDAQAQAVKDSNPYANFWSAVRGGLRGYSAVTGRPMPDAKAGTRWINRETGTLINGSGQNWRVLRDEVIVPWGAWLVLGVLVAIGLFFAFRGRVEIEGGRAGMRVRRWSGWERFVHWVTATAFVILAATGLSLLFGRAVLIPVLGYPGFAAWAQVARNTHEFVGPWIFTPGVALMIVMWIAHNLPEKGDLDWWRKAGGMLGRAHPSAGRLNAGEKLWFWFISSIGVACVVTGIIMAFPIEWGQVRNTMQLSNLIHGSAAILWVCFWFGHAYIGSVGSEGSLEAMTTGYVDVNWAKHHHDRWYAEIAESAEHVPEEPSGAPSQQPAT